MTPVTLSPVADFGPIILETDVDEAVYGTLRKWIPTYLTKIELERSFPNKTFPRPPKQSYTNTIEEDEFTDTMLPAVIVTTAAIEARPAKDGDGFYNGGYLCIVSGIVRGPTPPETRRNASILGACIRRVLLQQGDLDGFASETRWESSRIRRINQSSQAGRYLAASSQTFTVYVDKVLNEQNGPWEVDPVYPPADPDDPDTTYDLPVQVSAVTVEVDGVPVTQTPGA